MPSSLVQKQFGANAERYVKSQVHARGHSLTRMVELADPQQDWLALDVAPGGGHSAMAIARRVRQVVGLDITFDMLQAARNHSHAQGQTNIVWIQGDGTLLPVRESTFDLVTCRVALHHFPNQGAAITDWARALKPGGVMVLVDNIGPDDADAVTYVNDFETIRDPSHAWIYPLDELIDLVKQAGLEIGHSERLVKPMDFYPWMERMQVSENDQQRLHAMLWNSEGATREFLYPQGQDTDTTFHLWEGVIFAVRS